MKADSYRGLAPYLGIALATAFVLVFVLKLPFARLDVPYTFEGDDIDKIAQIQTVAETGWLFHNDRLGYPFGYDRLDFPRFDSLNYAIMGPIAALTGKPALTINLYYIAGFFLVAFAGLFAFRRLGLGTGVAMLCALVYAFLPYHVLRGIAHVTNGAYFLVPLAMLVLVAIARDEIGWDRPERKRRFVFSLSLAALIVWQTPYNGVFFVLLACVAGAIALAGARRWQTVLPVAAVILAAGAAFLVEIAPVIAHRATAGEPAFVAARIPSEADTYAMHLSQVLLPTYASRSKTLVHAKRMFDHAFGLDAPYLEVSNQYIGALGVFGFLLLGWALVQSVATRTRTGPVVADTTVDGTAAAVRICAVFAVAILVLALPSGLCTLIAYWITAKVRAYNRILPFFAFPCLLAAGWALQGLLRRIRRPWLGCAVLALIAIVAVWDVVISPRFMAHTTLAESWDRDRAYFAGIEQQLGPGATVFQLPVTWYPEQPPQNRMNSYAEFEPFLMTNTLRFSFGGAHGRPGYAWGKYIETRAAKEAVSELHAKGFAAVLVDAYAYADDAALAKVTDAYKAVLPAAPSVSHDRRWWLFPLDGCCGERVPPLESGRVPTLFTYGTNGAPLRFDETAAGRLYVASGWWDPEPWGIWSNTRARLRLKLDPVPSGASVLTIAAQVMVSQRMPERSVSVQCNGRAIGEAIFTETTPVQTLRFDIPAGLVKDDGVMELDFVTVPRTSPYHAGVADDDRELGVGLIELSIAPAGSAPHEP